MSTPEILEIFLSIEREILQIATSVRSNELSNTEPRNFSVPLEHEPQVPTATYCVIYLVQVLCAANEIVKRSPDSSEFKGEICAKDVEEQENSEICLQPTLETRKVLLWQEQAMAYVRALVAGFEMYTMDDLVLFAHTFGADRLRCD